LRTILFVVVFVCPPFLKKHLLKWFAGAKIGRHVHLGWFSTVMGKHIEFGDYSELRALSIIRCDGEVRIGAYSVVSNFVLAYGSAGLILGNRCYIGPQCLINADEEVRLGNLSALGPRCMVFTHGSFLPYTEGYWARLAAVTIGDNVWIAAGVFIHPGVKVGDNVFVNSRSVLTQDVPAGEAVEGNPARRVAYLEKLKRKMTPARIDAAAWQMLQQFAEVRLRRGMGIEVQSDIKNCLHFHHRGRGYLLLCIPSEGPVAELSGENGDRRLIILVNRPNWTPPTFMKSSLIFDLTTMRTRRAQDGVHAELWQFMRMYYGVTFQYE
jgi:acetyltransferase-like isoleucine patch superfamily enzyme